MPKSSKKTASVKQSGFGQRLAAARRERGMTQEELADKAGVHVSHVRRTEAGVAQPTVEIVKRLAEALAVSTDYLIFDRVSEMAARRLTDVELIEQFAAVESFSEPDKQAIKTLLTAMIVKQRVEAALPSRNPRAHHPSTHS